MKKICIPRKDHEVYFIPLPVNQDKESKNSYIMEQLHKLHPGFSSSSSIDIQEFRLDVATWIMVTVMEESVLTEYRIVHSGAIFYTLTSLLIRTPDFVRQPVRDFPSERIGFNPETKEPVSLPLTESEISSGSPENQNILPILMKKVPVRYGVFRKRRSLLLLLIPFILFVMLLCVLFIVKNSNAGKSGNGTLPVKQIQPLEIIPSPIKMLADISSLILEHGGIIQQWQYNEVALPAMVIHVEGADAGIISSNIKRFDYLKVSSVSDIQYNQDNPQYNISLAFQSEKYRSPDCTAFESMDMVFPVLNHIRENCTVTNTKIVSEILSSQTQNNAITINFDSPAVSFVQTLELLEQVLEEKALVIQQMSVLMNPSGDSFFWSCSLIPHMSNINMYSVSYDKQSIPISFGYKPSVKKETPRSQAVQIVNLTQSGSNKKIGTIYEGDNSKTIFYRNEEGKIIIQEE